MNLATKPHQNDQVREGLYFYLLEESERYCTGELGAASDLTYKKCPKI
jgi:hypothetical protein